MLSLEFYYILAVCRAASDYFRPVKLLRANSHLISDYLSKGLLSKAACNPIKIAN